MKYLYTDSKLKLLRQKLRTHPTKAEIFFWSRVRFNQLGFKIRRQHSVGRYVLDFYIPSIKLAIELDGDIHFLPKQMEYDRLRTEFLEGLGIKVVRFTNLEVFNNITGVIESITNFARQIAPPQQN